MAAIGRRLGETEGSAWIVGIILLAMLVFGIAGAANAVDPSFRAHAWMFAGAAVIGLAALIGWYTGSDDPGSRFDPTYYEEGVVKAGIVATMFWGIAGFVVGLVIALQLTWPNLFYFPDLGWTNFGRMRPLHTSAVIFAFGGNALIATSFYVVQRTCRTRLAGGMWPWFVFWGYQLFIVLAGTGYLLGVSEGREYAEPALY